MNPQELISSLIAAAAAHTGLDPAEIIGKCRETAHVEARWACWSVMRANGMTLQSIARAFSRDHATIIYGLRRAGDDHGNRSNSFRQLCEAVDSASSLLQNAESIHPETKP